MDPGEAFLLLKRATQLQDDPCEALSLLWSDRARMCREPSVVGCARTASKVSDAEKQNGASLVDCAPAASKVSDTEKQNGMCRVLSLPDIERVVSKVSDAEKLNGSCREQSLPDIERVVSKVSDSEPSLPGIERVLSNVSEEKQNGGTREPLRDDGGKPAAEKVKPCLRAGEGLQLLRDTSYASHDALGCVLATAAPPSVDDASNSGNSELSTPQRVPATPPKNPVIPARLDNNPHDPASHRRPLSPYEVMERARPASTKYETFISPKDVSGVPHTEEELRSIFNTLDTRNEGYLKVPELKAYYAALNDFGLAASSSFVEETVQKYGSLAKGKVTFDEFCIVMLRLAAQ
ncbi:hypothetical protein DIPPA_24457 [Diplonema papillatum]|nr:hypothetical protein DIPPA_24457 [Diplonema papillatum]